jgi:hypothetical protein
MAEWFLIYAAGREIAAALPPHPTTRRVDVNFAPGPASKNV